MIRIALALSGREGDSTAGAPVYRTLGSALASLPANGAARATIYIRNGRYREKLTIDRPRITLIGGPGALTSASRRVLDASALATYATSAVLRGWMPSR